MWHLHFLIYIFTFKFFFIFILICNVLSSSPETDADSSGEDSGQAAGDQKGRRRRRRRTFNTLDSCRRRLIGWLISWLIGWLICWLIARPQVSVCQMNQTRFYLVEDRKRAVQVGLLLGGLTPLLTKDQYVELIQDQLSIKSESPPPMMSRTFTWALLTSCVCVCRSPGGRQPRLQHSGWVIVT